MQLYATPIVLQEVRRLIFVIDIAIVIAIVIAINIVIVDIVDIVILKLLLKIVHDRSYR